MVRGLDSFREWFHGYEDRYVIIGGTACDLLMNDAGLEFRATKDIDLVLIIEAADAAFCRRFWDYVIDAGYEHRNKSTGGLEFYRFTDPKSKAHPAMIELFARKPNRIELPADAVLTPLPIDEEISSLSAILLNNEYYEFLRHGTARVSGVTILDELHMIPFKAKAWMDLSDRKSSGEQVDSRNIRKHKNDVFRLTELLEGDRERPAFLPQSVRDDMKTFLERAAAEEIDLKQLGIRGRTRHEILDQLKAIYG